MLKLLVASRMNRPVSEFVDLPEEIAVRELALIPFCQGLVARLQQAFPAEFERHAFYRWTLQPEDIQLAWGTDRPVAIQIDPQCEVICACGREFGHWPPESDAIGPLIDGLRGLP